MYHYYKQGRVRLSDANAVLNGGLPVYDPESRPQSFDAVQAYHVAAFKPRTRMMHAPAKKAA